MRENRFLTVFALIIVIYAVSLVAISQIRPIDGDEGYYAMAARLVADGGTVYEDFFYPQMPLMPSVYAPFYKLVGSSLADMRLLSVAFSILALLLWGLFLRARFGAQPFLVIGGLLLVALNPYLLSWNVTVKTYALTNLGVFATLWAVDRGFHTRRWAWFLLAGFTAGVTVDTRLLYLPWAGSLFLALMWLKWRYPQLGLSPITLLVTAVGFVLGMAPALYLFWADPARFRFNNLDYHKLRFNPLDRLGNDEVPQILAALKTLGQALFLNPFLLVLIVLAILGWLAVRRADHERGSDLRPIALLAGVGGLVHVLACLFPDPVHAQYFTSPLAPMLAPLMVLGVVDLVGRFGRPATVITGVVALAAVLCFVDLQVRKTGMDWQDVWSFDHLADVSRNIDSLTESGDQVLSFWSGYVFEAEQDFLPGTENHFALGVSEKLTLYEQADYHIIGQQYLLRALQTKTPKVVVLGAWMHEINTTLDQKDLPLILQELDANYRIAWMRGEVKVMVRR